MVHHYSTVFNAEKYAAAMWIKDGRHSASDKPSGRKAPDPDDNVQHKCKLMQTVYVK